MPPGVSLTHAFIEENVDYGEYRDSTPCSIDFQHLFFKIFSELVFRNAWSLVWEYWECKKEIS